MKPSEGSAGVEETLVLTIVPSFRLTRVTSVKVPPVSMATDSGILKLEFSIADDLF
jgi:hypothetical protein